MFLLVGINVKMFDRAAAVRASSCRRGWWIRWLSVLFILPWAVPSIPTILSFRFMLNPEWGIINQLDLPADRRGRPELAQRSRRSRCRFAIVVHIWKSLPFWTLILLAGRLAIPGDLYEAASVDGASDLAEVPLHHLAVDAARSI